MNISTIRFGEGNGAAGAFSFKIQGASNTSGTKAQKKDDDKKTGQNDVAAVVTISSRTAADRTKAITKRYQSMKETIQSQIDSLNERLKKVSAEGNVDLETQLVEDIKELASDYNALDEQLKTALFEEQQRKAAAEQKSIEKAEKQREKEREKFKTDEERIKNEDRKQFEFFAKSDKAIETIQNAKIQKATLERSKGRLEGEMATDAAASADREQRQRARLSELKNGFSQIPYVSDKTILTEKKRISYGVFTSDEAASAKELGKLNRAIENTEGVISGEIAGLNEAVKERIENIKKDGEAGHNHKAERDDNERQDENSEADKMLDDKDNNSAIR